MKRLHLIILMSLLCHAANAQEPEGEQLLVFRNTGEVNLLFTNEIDSIVTNGTAQVFYAKDTVLVVPIAELDSVAVGNRNVRQLSTGARELTDDNDLPWLIRVEENHLYYRQDTPADVLPMAGEKLFYGTSHELLPFGLTVHVLSTNLRNGEYDVEIENIPLEDIFDLLFYSGRVTLRQKSNSPLSRKNAPVDLSMTFGFPEALDFGEMGQLGVNGEMVLSGDFVVDLTHHYYHADFKADTEIGLDYSLRSDDSDLVEFESPRLSFTLPTVAWVIIPRVSLSLYTSAEAELAINYSMKRKFSFEFEWTRKDGNQTCQFRQPQEESEGADDEVKMDLTLKGEIFLGARAMLDLSIPGNLAGFRADMKFGPNFTGELGLGMLNEMRNYNPQAFFTSTLKACMKLGATASVYTHEHFLVFGNEIELPFYEHEFRFFEHEIDLFPNYQHTFAMLAPPTNTQRREVSVATAISEPTPTDLETGFEIVNSQGEVVDSVYVGTILSKPENPEQLQAFDTSIVIPSSQTGYEGYTMRPIFHYAGHTLSAAPVGVKKDVLIQPYTSTKSNGAMTFISSGPFLASTDNRGTHYQLGAWLPVIPINNVYNNHSGKSIGLLIDATYRDYLIGTWNGFWGEETLTLTFKEDGTGRYNEHGFRYEVNMPQTGDILLTFENDEQIVYRVISLTETELQLSDKKVYSIKFLKQDVFIP